MDGSCPHVIPSRYNCAKILSLHSRENSGDLNIVEKFLLTTNTFARKRYKSFGIMSTIVIEIAGILLLLSSVVSLILLLKKNFKQRKISPLCVLVTSDIIMSFFISILLVFNKYNEIALQGSEGSTKNNIMEVLERINGTNKEEKTTVDCEVRLILMHYALFLIPFTNSFISLLSMAIQYNCDVDILHTKCRSLRTFDDSNQPKNPGFMNSIGRRNTLTIISVAGQWIIPILSTMILLVAGHEKTVDISSADMTCVFTTNFPFENYYFIMNDHDIEMSNATGHLLGNKINYIDKPALERLQPNSSTSDEIVSKVYGIVELALQSLGMRPQKPEGYYGTMELLNVTSFGEIPDVQNDEDEIELFENLVINVSNHYIPHISTETSILTTSTDNLSTTSIKPSHVASNAQIFKDIVQKIHSNKLNVRHRGKPRFLPKGRLYVNEDYRRVKFQEKIGGKDMKFPGTSYMKNQCFISTNFLKVHLFLLTIFIYFGPIILSTTFNIRSHYMCSSALERLAISDRMLPSISSFESTPSGPNKPSRFGWFGPKHEYCEKVKTSNDAVQVESSVIKEGEYFYSMKGGVEQMKKLSNTFKTLLITTVVLWSPMFLHVLMKVFLCSDPPMWLIHFFYLVAISLGALRNYLNLKMLKSSEILINSSKKKNIVHPTPGLSTSQPE